MINRNVNLRNGDVNHGLHRPILITGMQARSTQLRILNWNVEGLCSKLGEADFLQYVNSFDVVCFTETFLEYKRPLDYFSEFIQFMSPAIKITQQGRRCGGVLIMAKRRLEKHIKVLDLSQDNMVWLKFDKSVFSSDRDVILCGVYICPYDSPYYRQEHVNVTSTLTIVEQCLLDYINHFDDACHILLCGDFNARTGHLNSVELDMVDDVQALAQIDLYGNRKSEDKVVNAYGRLLLDMCAASNTSILNGVCSGDENGSFTYVCSAGCSTIDYYVASRELAREAELRVAERFDSKHLPVELLLSCNTVELNREQTMFIEKLVWDEAKTVVFQEAIISNVFESAVAEATGLLHQSVDEAVERFNTGLLQASECMRKRVYVGPRQSRWFDAECRVAKRNTRRNWRHFRRASCEESRSRSRLLYVECRKQYRLVMKNKQQTYKKSKLMNLVNKARDPKLFWIEVKSVCQSFKSLPNIDADDWFRHFREVFSAEDPQAREIPEAQLYTDPASVEFLDRPISAEEVLSAVRHMKINKAPGPDGVLAGMLKNSIPQTLHFIVALFNQIFDSGVYPSSWTGAIVVPIHKAGRTDIPDNYRGVSLLSILGKVFSQIINKRLSTWAAENNKIDETQSGFRAGYSTVDNIFVLYAIVQKYLLRRSGKVYVCFVDFRKAFDWVNRAVLWNTLRKAGVGGKMLQVLQSMYRTVKACVRCPDTLTEFFDCPCGVRQGCVLSPTLFSFLINELALEMAQKGLHGIQLSPDIVQILILLFADDVVLSSYSVFGLQNQIDVLKQFADNSCMKVNLDKTKIIVFRKGGFLAEREVWTYGDTPIEVVNSYKYLGMHFTTKLSLNLAVSELASKAKLRTIQILRCLFKLGNVQRDIFFKIYDAQVLPMLMYGAEIWGFQEYEVLEKVHLFACKRFLHVGLQTPNKMVLGDLGRYPLYITSAMRCVKYWLKLTRLPVERLPRKAYQMLRQLCDNGKKTWVFHLMHLLIDNGFAEAWAQQSVGDERVFIAMLRQRFISRFQQSWYDAISTRDRFDFYFRIKRVFCPESYFDCEQIRCFRDIYTQFRFGISPINTHRLRYRAGTSPRQLLCPICKVGYEDEVHVLFMCNAYTELRDEVQILKRLNQEHNLDASVVMSAVDDLTVIEVSRFLYKVFKKRSASTLNPCHF